ncbi:hypothetical protein OGAPHI_006132 [Ogataea philodendri]|uniref:Uncharacterized protein n=1 Tax=Ogataea philodendri TaxID=1378263 RepID=A0A9P8T0N6_9ASCO|nr:uncharacterized protein OGAPHI_006132 [Ogataea philodendri]KAH3661953.1 hypothetical protein OGAPHI_006132 [Ogataea philodendri]
MVRNVLAHHVLQFAGVLHSALTQVRISSNLALQVVLRLSVTRQPNVAGFDVQVHDVESDSALQVALDLVDDDLGIDVDEFDETEVFVCLQIHGLVMGFIVLDLGENIILSVALGFADVIR